MKAVRNIFSGGRNRRKSKSGNDSFDDGHPDPYQAGPPRNSKSKGGRPAPDDDGDDALVVIDKYNSAPSTPKQRRARSSSPAFRTFDPTDPNSHHTQYSPSPDSVPKTLSGPPTPTGKNTQDSNKSNNKNVRKGLLKGRRISEPPSPARSSPGGTMYPQSPITPSTKTPQSSNKKKKRPIILGGKRGGGKSTQPPGPSSAAAASAPAAAGPSPSPKKKPIKKKSTSETGGSSAASSSLLSEEEELFNGSNSTSKNGSSVVTPTESEEEKKKIELSERQLLKRKKSWKAAMKRMNAKAKEKQEKEAAAAAAANNASNNTSSDLSSANTRGGGVSGYSGDNSSSSLSRTPQRKKSTPRKKKSLGRGSGNVDGGSNKNDKSISSLEDSFQSTTSTTSGKSTGSGGGNKKTTPTSTKRKKGKLSKPIKKKTSSSTTSPSQQQSMSSPKSATSSGGGGSGSSVKKSPKKRPKPTVGAAAAGVSTPADIAMNTSSNNVDIDISYNDDIDDLLSPPPPPTSSQTLDAETYEAMSNSFPNLHESDDDEDKDNDDDAKFVDGLLQKMPEREQVSHHHSSPDHQNQNSADIINEVAIEELLTLPGSPITTTTNTNSPTNNAQRSSTAESSMTSLSMGSPSTFTKSFASTDNSKSTLDYSIDSNLLRSFSSSGGGGDFNDLGSDGTGGGDRESIDELHYSSLTLRGGVEDEGITELPEDSGRPYVAQQYPSIAAPNVPNSNMSEWSDEDDETGREYSDDDDDLSLDAIPEAPEEEEDGAISTDEDDGALINELSNRNSSTWEEGEAVNNSASTENDITLASSSDDEDMVKGTMGDDDTDDDDGPLTQRMHIDTSSHHDLGREKSGHGIVDADGSATPMSDQVNMDETIDEDQNDSDQILNYNASSWDDEDDKVDDLNHSTDIKTDDDFDDGNYTDSFDTFANPSADTTDDEPYGQSRRSLDMSEESLEPPPPPQVELMSSSSGLGDSRKNDVDSEGATPMDSGDEVENEQIQEEDDHGKQEVNGIEEGNADGEDGDTGTVQETTGKQDSGRPPPRIMDLYPPPVLTSKFEATHSRFEAGDDAGSSTDGGVSDSRLHTSTDESFDSELRSDLDEPHKVSNDGDTINEELEGKEGMSSEEEWSEELENMEEAPDGKLKQSQMKRSEATAIDDVKDPTETVTDSSRDTDPEIAHYVSQQHEPETKGASSGGSGSKLQEQSNRSDLDNRGDVAEIPAPTNSEDELNSEPPHTKQDGASMTVPPPSRDDSVKLAHSNSSSISLDSNSTATDSDYDASQEGQLDAYGEEVKKSVIGLPPSVSLRKSMDNSSDSASTFNPSPGVDSDDGVVILSEQDMLELSTGQLAKESEAQSQTVELDSYHAEGGKLNHDKSFNPVGTATAEELRTMEGGSISSIGAQRDVAPNAESMSSVIDRQETQKDSTSLSNSDPALDAVLKASPVTPGHSSVPAGGAAFHGSWRNNSAQGASMAADFRSPTIEKLQAAKKAATMKLRSGLSDLREHSKVELSSAAEEQNRLEAELASSLQVMSSQSKVIDLLRDQNLSSKDQLSTALSNVKLLMEEKLDLKRKLNQTEASLEESQKETKLAKEEKHIFRSADEKASKISSLEKELGDQVLKCKTLEEKLVQADLELDKMEIEMENLYEEMENLKETLAEYQSSKDQLDEAIVQLEERERAIDDLTRLLGEKDLKILELGQNSGESTTETSETEDGGSARQDAETRMDDMRQRLAASLDEIEALKDELRQSKNRLATFNMAIQRQSETSGESIDAENETDSLKQENTTLNTRLNEELVLANEQSQRILSLEQELEERLVEKKEMEDKLSAAFTNLDEAKSEAEVREEEMNMTKAEASLLRDKLEGLQMASAAALVQKDGSIASLQRSLTEFKMDEADNEELAKQLKQVEKELAEAKLAVTEAGESTADKISTLSAENATLKDRVKNLQMETLAMLKSKDRSIAELQEKIDEYENEDEPDSANLKVKELQSDLDIAKQRLRKVDKLETANDKLRRDLDTMKFETTTKLSGKDLTISGLRKTVREQSKKLTERDSEIARSKTELQDALSLKNKKQQSQQDGYTTKRLRTMEQENTRLRQQLQQLQQKTDKQLLMKDETIQATQQEVREAKNALRDASQRIAVLWEENARLQRMANGK